MIRCYYLSFCALHAAHRGFDQIQIVQVDGNRTRVHPKVGQGSVEGLSLARNDPYRGQAVSLFIP